MEMVDDYPSQLSKGCNSSVKSRSPDDDYLVESMAVEVFCLIM